MGLFRNVSAPQVIKAGVAVLLPVVVGPTVPVGSSAAVQALAAYREGPRLTQPARPVITQGGAAPVAYVPPAEVLQVQPPTWPHAQVASRTPPASQFGIDDADLIFDRLWPIILPAPTWPYSATAAAAARPRTPPPAVTLVLAEGTLQLPPVAAWPYTAAMLPEAAAALSGIVAVYLAPQPITVQVQQPWPHAAVAARVLEGLPDAGPATVPAGKLQALAAPWVSAWPHAAVARAAASSPALVPVQGSAPPAATVQWSAPSAWPFALAQRLPALPIVAADSVPEQASPGFVAAQPWPYVATMLPRAAAPALVPLVTMYTWAPAIMPPPAPPWPMAATRLAAATASRWAQAAPPVLLASPVQQPVPAQAWPSIVAQPARGGAALLQPAPSILLAAAVPMPQRGAWWRLELAPPRAVLIVGGPAPVLRVQAYVPPATTWPHARALPARLLPPVLPPAPSLLAAAFRAPDPAPWPYAMLAGSVLRALGGVPPRAVLLPNPGRTYVIEAETRLLAVEAEDRVLRVSPGQGTIEMRNKWLIDRKARLDWTWDLAARGWLKVGDAIVSHQISGTGFTYSDDAHTDTTIVAFIEPTPQDQPVGTVIYPRADWVTQQGRRDGRILQLKLTDRGWHEI